MKPDASPATPHSSISDLHCTTEMDSRGLEATQSCQFYAYNQNAPHFSSVDQTTRSSSTSCQWSFEERILARERLSSIHRGEEDLYYPMFSKTSAFHSSYSHHFHEYDIPFRDTTHEGQGLDHGFGRHRHKLTGDPTLLLSLIRWTRIGSSRLEGDEDQIDRLNHRITSVVLLLLIAVTGLRQYISHLPLQCWIPQEFSRSWEEYAEHYCWVTDTYFARVQSRLPKPADRKNVVHYYQWAPFVLALQAVGFVLPSTIWRLFQNSSGFHVPRIVRSAMQLNFSSPKSMMEAIKGLACYMDAIIYRRQYKHWQPSANKLRTNGKRKQKTWLYDLIHVQGNVKMPPPPTGQTELSTPAGPIQRSHKKHPAPLPPLTTSVVQKQSNCCGKCLRDAKCLCPVSWFKFPTHAKSKYYPKPGEYGGSEWLHGSEQQSRAKYENNHSSNLCCPCLFRNCKGTSKVRTPRTCRSEAFGKMTQYSNRCLWMIFHALWRTVRMLCTVLCLFPGCLSHWLRSSKRYKCIHKSNSFLFYLYSTTKCLYILNLVGQIWFMRHFLGTESYIFGFHMLRDMINGKQWSQTGNFPRVTYCDFETKKTGKNYKYTLQCVLPLNLFLEKIYVFLWFWMMFLLLLTTYNVIKWLTRLSSLTRRRHFIEKFIISWKYSHRWEGPLESKLLNIFVDKYLDRNGVLLLWLISINSGDLVAAELSGALWDLFQSRLFALKVGCQTCGQQSGRIQPGKQTVVFVRPPEESRLLWQTHSPSPESDLISPMNRKQTSFQPSTVSNVHPFGRFRSLENLHPMSSYIPLLTTDSSLDSIV